MIKTHSFKVVNRHKRPLRPDEISTNRTGLYDHKWRQARAIFLRRNPLCASCAKEGKICEATEVDHIIPHRGDMKLFWNKENWQGLCREAHSRKTASEVNARKRDGN